MSGSSELHDGGALVRRSAASTVASLFAAQARIHPDRPAIEDGARALSYGELGQRARRLASVLLRVLLFCVSARLDSAF